MDLGANAGTEVRAAFDAHITRFTRVSRHELSFLRRRFRAPLPPLLVLVSGFLANRNCLQSVGEVCIFLRWQRKFPIPSSAAFGKIGDEYVKAVYRFAETHQIPVVHFKKGQNKEEVVRRIWKQQRAGESLYALTGSK